jgi:carbohydrate-selective porin OprB
MIAGSARADLVEDPCACSANKPGFFRRGTLTGDWGGLRDQWKADGVIVQATYAGEVFAAPGLHDQLVAAGLAVASLDLDFGLLFHDAGATAHVSGLAIHGDGLTAELMDVYGVSGNVAPEDVRLFEAWAEQPFGPVTVRAGLLSADQEFILAKHSTALLDATFGIISQLSFDVEKPVYPFAAPAVSARYETKKLTVRAAVFTQDAEDAHGIPTSLDSTPLAIGEIEWAQLVKLGGWHDGARGDGAYAIIDHGFARRLGAFARVSVSPDQAVTSYVDTGLRIGPGPWRKTDFVGIGLAFARTDDPTRGSQTVFEATYQAQFGWLTVQPDFQVLTERPRTTAIFATRVTIVL